MKYITVDLEKWILEEILMCDTILACEIDLDIRTPWRTRKTALRDVLKKAGCQQ